MGSGSQHDAHCGEEAVGIDPVPSPSWKDLPPAFLCHILHLAPYKRAHVKAVCSSWRSAINGSLNEVAVPAADLRLALRQLPHVRHLTVQGPVAQQEQPGSDGLCPQPPPAQQLSQLQLAMPCWPPRSAESGRRPMNESAAAAAAAACSASPSSSQAASRSACSSSSSSSASSPWQVAGDRLLARLHSLRLLDCGQQVQQLADRLSSSCSSSSSDRRGRSPASAAGLASLQLLQLARADGDITHVLAALLQLAATGQPPQQLEQLLLQRCSVAQPHAEQLPALQALPALRELELSGCFLVQLPASVCGCSRLTKLVLRDNLLVCLPDELAHLASLKVLDLSGCCKLRLLGAGLAGLTSLEELHLAGPSGLWLDHSSADASTSSGCSGSSSGGSAAAARAALPLPALPHQQQLALLPELGALLRLTQLDLSANWALAVLPASLARLGQLRLLDASGAGIRWLGEELLACGALQQLLLEDNNVLADVPDGISQLSALQVLDLGGCTALWRLPIGLLALKALQRLVLPSKAIEQGLVERLQVANPMLEVHMTGGDAWSDDAYDDNEGWGGEGDGDGAAESSD